MMSRLLIPVLILLAIMVVGCGDDETTTPEEARPGFAWTTIPPGTNNYLIDISFDASGESYIAVGANGTLIRSSRGDQLHQLDTPTEADLFGVTHVGEEFVAVGDSGTILMSSSGGTDWQKANTDNLALETDDWLYAIASSGSQTVAVGHEGAIVTSTDGSTWTRVEDANIPVSANLYGITYQPDSGMFVAVGASGIIITSSDGLTWQWDSTLHSTSALYDVTWASELGLYFAVGQHGTILSSEDAHEWELIESRPEGYLFAVEWSGERLVIVGDDGWLLTSDDGEIFTLRDARLQDWRGIHYSSTRAHFVAVGVGQTIVGSDDGAEWEIEFDGWKLDINAIACWDTSDTLCLAAGTQGTILKGSHGVDWSMCFAGPNVELNGIAGRLANDTMIVAVGNDGTILTSANLATWDTVLTKPVLLDLYAVATGSAGFAAVGDNGTVLHSADGSAWALVSDIAVTEQDLYGIASNTEGYVAVGDSGTVLTSTNGEQWISGTVGSTRDLFGISWIDTMFVAVGDSGAVFTSTNGTSWNEQQWYDEPVSLSLSSVAGSGNVMVAVGPDGTWLVSEDAGLNWTSLSVGADLGGIIWTGTRFVAVGDYAAIISSP